MRPSLRDVCGVPPWGEGELSGSGSFRIWDLGLSRLGIRVSGFRVWGLGFSGLEFGVCVETQDDGLCLSFDFVDFLVVLAKLAVRSQKFSQARQLTLQPPKTQDLKPKP